MVLDICITFHEIISNSSKVTERARVYDRNHYLLCLKGNNSKNRPSRVMDLVFCMSSHGALHLYNVA